MGNVFQQSHFCLIFNNYIISFPLVTNPMFRKAQRRKIENHSLFHHTENANVLVTLLPQAYIIYSF